MVAADCDPLMLCPNDAIALFAPALPARTLDKPGAPVGMLKVQFDPLPSCGQECLRKLPRGGAECTELAICHPACAHLRVSCLGILLQGEARRSSERRRAST